MNTTLIIPFNAYQRNTALASRYSAEAFRREQNKASGWTAFGSNPNALCRRYSLNVSPQREARLIACFFSLSVSLNAMRGDSFFFAMASHPFFDFWQQKSARGFGRFAQCIKTLYGFQLFVCVLSYIVVGVI